jgi:hypothetical protein
MTGAISLVLREEIPMEITVAFPTIQDEELLKRADAFAENLVARLDEFNKENFQPEMDEEAWARFRERYKDGIPGPTPRQMIGAFKNRFFQYMQSRYGIIP